MKIRLMTAEDAPKIAGVLNREIESGVAHFSTALTDATEVLGDWRRAGERYPWLVAEGDSGAFLGFARGSSWNPREAYLWTVATAIYLVPEACGRGVGGMLYRRLFAVLGEQGFRVAIAGVSVPNPASERLHESVGMSAIGEIDPAGYKHGRWVPVRWYQKRIGVCEDKADPGPIWAVSGVWARMEQERAHA
ncbi:MAG: N-acetyltransferase family protein [Phycisphaerales bacterium]